MLPEHQLLKPHDVQRIISTHSGGFVYIYMLYYRYLKAGLNLCNRLPQSFEYCIILIDSSVGGVARGQRYFRFALRSPGEALLVKKGGVLGCFWGFSAPRKAGRLGKWRKNKRAANQRPSLAQTWPLYIYTIERTFVLAYLINIYIELPSKIYGLHIAPNQAKSTEFV